MLGDFLTNIFYGFLTVCPVLALPVGFAKAIGFLIDVVGYINVFVPVIKLAPIVALIIMVRNFKVTIALLRFVLQFIPFIG